MGRKSTTISPFAAEGGYELAIEGIRER